MTPPLSHGSVHDARQSAARTIERFLQPKRTRRMNQMNQIRSSAEARTARDAEHETAQMALEVLRLDCAERNVFPQLKDAAERTLLQYFKATEASGDAQSQV